MVKNMVIPYHRHVPFVSVCSVQICVQTGRVVFVNQKKYANKLGVIVNVIDQNRALCDIFSPHGPKLRFLNRASVQFKVMRLTKFMVKGVFHNSYSKFVTDKVREQTILSQFQKTKFYQNWQKRFKVHLFIYTFFYSMHPFYSTVIFLVYFCGHFLKVLGNTIGWVFGSSEKVRKIGMTAWPYLNS